MTPAQVFYTLVLFLGTLLFSACKDKAGPGEIPHPQWQGRALSFIDSTSSDSSFRESVGFAFLPVTPIKGYRWAHENERDSIGLHIWAFQQPWQARLAWQAIPGLRSNLAARVMGRGSQWLIMREYLVQIENTSGGLLSGSEIADQLKIGDWKPGEEPGFSQPFLQQNRIIQSGWVLPADFLGLPWNGALFGMNYEYLGDTVRVIIAGIQDSTFFDQAGVHRLGIQPDGKPRYGLNSTHFRMKEAWLWSANRHFIVGLQGCPIFDRCSIWAQNQQKALEVFETNRFFTRKNAGLN